MSGNRINVLIVEDDPGTAKIAKAFCEGLGCEAHLAANGMEALQCYEAHRVDVVLLDLQMPVMGGYETAYELRLVESEQGKTPVPIIAVTGTPTPEAHMRSVAGGMNGCVGKPYSTEMLDALFSMYVEGYAPEEAAAEAAVGRSSAG